jgi:hypothetical protein
VGVEGMKWEGTQPVDCCVAVMIGLVEEKSVRKWWGGHFIFASDSRQ